MTPTTDLFERARLSRRARALRSSEIRDLLHLAARPEVISLAGGLPDPSGFPVADLGGSSATMLRDRPERALQYGPTEGDTELRALVAERHTKATGRHTSVDQVLITSGSQQGLDLLARVLADPGDTVAVEDPGYLGALQAFAAAGLDLVPVPAPHDGLDVDALAHTLDHATTPPAFVYTVPTFQNPTGATLPMTRRRALATLADRHDLLVVEDTPYADLWFDEPAPPSIASLSDRVVTLGTVSKTLAPGLRVGWMIGPRWLVNAATTAKQAVDLHTSSLGQALVATLLGDTARFDHHLAGVRSSYAARASALVEALHTTFGDRIEVDPPRGGMFVWARLPDIDTRALLRLAAEEGTAFVPGDAFAVTADLRDRLRLSFATCDPARLVEAVVRLGRALDRIGAEPPAA
jgi:2-aminoadipate transaminase